VGHGWFFWNFKTELEPKWDYIRSVEAGWLPRDAQASSREVALACAAEDTGEKYACTVKPGATHGEIIAGVNWACATAKIALPGCGAADDESKVVITITIIIIIIIIKQE
jgi:glucan 1,3-beta-glucosidase